MQLGSSYSKVWSSNHKGMERLQTMGIWGVHIESIFRHTYIWWMSHSSIHEQQAFLMWTAGYQGFGLRWPTHAYIILYTSIDSEDHEETSQRLILVSHLGRLGVETWPLWRSLRPIRSIRIPTGHDSFASFAWQMLKFAQLGPPEANGKKTVFCGWNE